jgi:nicotinamide-nucleotide amidase
MTTTIEKLAHMTGLALKKRAFKLVTAESCTGGGIGYWITAIPGSSAWFDRGFITYSNSAKVSMLNVSKDTLQQFGSVSQQTAREMAEGALHNSEAHISIAVTGIAGPDGGTPEKPVGTVWIAYAGRNIETNAFVRIFPGNRQDIREQTIITALENVLDYLARSSHS